MRWLAIAMAGVLAITPPCLAISINEIRIDQPGLADNDEYFELAGESGASLHSLTYLVIGDGVGSGTVEAVISLANQFIPDDGYFLAIESTFGAPGTPFQSAVPDLTTILNFEDNDNVTHLLVDGFFGALNEDLDTDDDGTLDLLPWTQVVDAVCLIRDPAAGSPDHYYCGQLGGTVVGPAGKNTTPRHVFRIPDQNGSFQIGSDILGVDDTPGEPNAPTGVGGCDFDDDGMCDCTDVDSLVGAIAAGTNDIQFDMNGDGQVDLQDLDQWLQEAGESHLPSQAAYPMGDATLDGSVNGQDFVAWNNHKFTDTARWCAGDFNADGSVNGQDFVVWNNHKFTSADSWPAAVPEPAPSVLLVGLSGLLAIRSRAPLRCCPR